MRHQTVIEDYDAMMAGRSRKQTEEEFKFTWGPSKIAKEKVEYAQMPSLTFINWFLTFLIQDIPIIGEIALIIWACQKGNAEGKRQYALARLVYKIIFDIIAIVTLVMVYMITTNVLQGLVNYMDKL